MFSDPKAGFPENKVSRRLLLENISDNLFSIMKCCEINNNSQNGYSSVEKTGRIKSKVLTQGAPEHIRT